MANRTQDQKAAAKWLENWQRAERQLDAACATGNAFVIAGAQAEVQRCLDACPWQQTH